MEFEAIIEALVKSDEVEFKTKGGVVYWLVKEGKVLCEGETDAVLADLHHPNSLEALNTIYQRCPQAYCSDCVRC